MKYLSHSSRNSGAHSETESNLTPDFLLNEILVIFLPRKILKYSSKDESLEKLEYGAYRYERYES